MQLWIYCAISLLLLQLVKATKVNRTKRTIIGYYPLCPRGCASCSTINGCVTCRPRLFMLLHRAGMRQTGICMHSCPAGYFGARRREFNKCNKCKIEHCESCFSRSYCTSCTPPYLAYRGKCIDRCPEGLYYANYSKECLPKVDCGVGTWSGWGFCIRKGQTCGYKYGVEARLRDIIQLPSPNGRRCPAVTESRRCRMRMRSCVDLEHNKSDPSTKPNNKKRKRRKNKKKNRRKNRKNGKKNRKKNRRKNRRFRPLPPDVTTNQISALILNPR